MEGKLWIILFVIVLLATLGIVAYSFSLQKDYLAQKSEIRQINSTLSAIQEDYLFVKYFCTADKYCKERLVQRLTVRLLEKNGFSSNTEEYTSGGLNFYKYMVDPPGNDGINPKEDVITTAFLSFVKNNCSPALYERQGPLVTKYRYRINDKKVVEILMDDDAAEIVCAWVKDEEKGTFTKVQ